MWWYSNGWWWWWVAFVVIFFLLPLGYGWGYRGWGPWYRRRRAHEAPRGEGVPPPSGANYPPGESPSDEETGWGWAGAFLWLIFIVAIIWLVAAWGWGGRWGRGY